MVLVVGLYIFRVSLGEYGYVSLYETKYFGGKVLWWGL